MPIRVQLSREKGWRIPVNTVKVSRPGRWGNPFRLGHHYKRDAYGGIPRLSIRFTYLEAFEGHQDASYTTILTNTEAVEWFRWYRGLDSQTTRTLLLTELRGKNLACWCPLEDAAGNRVPCHADVLLEIANPGWRP